LIFGSAQASDAIESVRPGGKPDRQERGDPTVIDADMRAVIDGQRLCYAATVTPDGRPSLSPKGTIRVWDEAHLYFLDIASPRTRANLALNPWIEINVVDPLSRRGYRFLGRAEIHTGGDVYERGRASVIDEEGDEYHTHALILITVELVLPVVSPGYLHVADEAGMRSAWKVRRSELEARFERHLGERAGGRAG
jgi:predicted pyridoxine 5'-phosphate oxidase superfamily flavin-nucleotide-binding protein